MGWVFRYLFVFLLCFVCGVFLDGFFWGGEFMRFWMGLGLGSRDFFKRGCSCRERI